jgi:hypothetical protein
VSDTLSHNHDTCMNTGCRVLRTSEHRIYRMPQKNLARFNITGLKKPSDFSAAPCTLYTSLQNTLHTHSLLRKRCNYAIMAIKTAETCCAGHQENAKIPVSCVSVRHKKLKEYVSRCYMQWRRAHSPYSQIHEQGEVFI